MVKIDAKAEQAWEIIRDIADPELPFLTIEDLGVLRSVGVDRDGLVNIEIAPTYIGCPGMAVIDEIIRRKLMTVGYESKVIRSFSPPWSSDWITKQGIQKLKQAGISAPLSKSSNNVGLKNGQVVACVRCGSMKTEKISEFGSSACKALYRCISCKEPFDHFKCT